MKRPILLSIFLCFFACSFAAEVDTLLVHSTAMNKDIKTVVIQPEGEFQDPLPTIYLLHGYSGNYSNWVELAPAVKQLADQYGILVVCPDGGFGSWYWDIPGDPDFQYETFVSSELVSYIDQHYPVADDRAKRGITGLSMGGHGALYLAIRHQDVFGAAGSTSGGVDIRPFPNNWDMAKRLGPYWDNKEKWDEHTVMEQLHLIKPGSLQLFIDCGQQDFFYQVNLQLHERLDYLNIPHRFLQMPGVHNWAYWSQSIWYQMAFFAQVFSGEKGA